MSLDFSKMRTAAYGLWSHSNRLFALSSSNALLEFLLDVSGIALCIIMCARLNVLIITMQENTKFISYRVEKLSFSLAIFFQGAPQLTENYLDSKKVKAEVFIK